MTPADLVSELELHGVELKTEGGRVFYRPAGKPPANLVSELRAHKPRVLEVLDLTGWPQECQEAVTRLGQRHARLFPLLGKRVKTPWGPGRLIQVIASRAAVVLDRSPDTATYFLWDEVLPGQRVQGGES